MRKLIDRRGVRRSASGPCSGRWLWLSAVVTARRESNAERRVLYLSV